MTVGAVPPQGIGLFSIGVGQIGRPPDLNVWDTIISQYANSPSITTLIANASERLNPTENIDAFYDMIWNINTAQGYGLDVWGRIVGVGRVLQLPNASYLGFSGPSGPSGLPWNVGTWYNGQSTTGNFAMSDPVYRIVILAKATSNLSDATIPSINRILNLLFGAGGPLPVRGNCYCTDGLNMTITYTFGDILTPVQAAIVFQSGVIPKPAGVSSTVVQL